MYVHDPELHLYSGTQTGIYHRFLEHAVKFRERLIKIGAKLDDNRCINSVFSRESFWTKDDFFSETSAQIFEIGAVQRIADLVLLEKC